MKYSITKLQQRLQPHEESMYESIDLKRSARLLEIVNIKEIEQEELEDVKLLFEIL